MRIIVGICSVLLFAIAASSQGPTEDADPYSLSLVRSVLKMNASGQRVVHGWSVKGLSRLGDRVSVALLKVLDTSDLTNPSTIRSYLPIIRQAFDQPQLITVQSDKKPRVTLFFLETLLQTVGDDKTEQDLREAIAFVKAKADDPAIR
jgi:hypothetical protein